MKSSTQHEISMEERIRLLVEFLDTLIADADRELKRCEDAGQIASVALYDGTRSAFFTAKKAVLRILLDQKTEVQ